MTTPHWSLHPEKQHQRFKMERFLPYNESFHRSNSKIKLNHFTSNHSWALTDKYQTLTGRIGTKNRSKKTNWIHTDLKKAALRGEYSNVTIVSSSTSTAHGFWFRWIRASMGFGSVREMEMGASKKNIAVEPRKKLSRQENQTPQHWLRNFC